jgi:hypothetical protein
MAKPAAVKQLSLINNPPESAFTLSATHIHYLNTVRQLLVEYQHAHGREQIYIFIKMIHSFMHELCSYPLSSYIVTTTSYSNAEFYSRPHAVDNSNAGDQTLFYFTASQSPDDVQDLWVKRAQVYLADPQKGDAVAECATKVVFTNFFILDGANKDRNTGAWNLWSASDLEGARVARVDLRNLEDDIELASQMSHVVQQRLQTIQYQIPPNVRKPDSHSSEALAALRQQARMEDHRS